MTPLAHVILILVAWVICQPLPQRAAVPVLTFMGAIGIAIYAPVAALFILITAVEAAIMVLAFSRLERGSGWRKWGTYLLLLNLLFVDFNEIMLGIPVAILGISFSVIRIFMTAR